MDLRISLTCSSIIIIIIIYTKSFYRDVKIFTCNNCTASDGTQIKEYLKLKDEKEPYSMTQYLKSMENISHRRIITKLRTGYNCLFEMKGRYDNLRREERICPLCKVEQDDLDHFLFRCSKLKKEQNELLNTFRKVDPKLSQKPLSSLKSRLLTFCFTDKSHMERLGKSILKLYKLREKSEEK